MNDTPKAADTDTHTECIYTRKGRCKHAELYLHIAPEPCAELDHRAVVDVVGGGIMDGLHRALLVNMILFSLFAVLYGQEKNQGGVVANMIIAVIFGVAFIVVP